MYKQYRFDRSDDHEQHLCCLFVELSPCWRLLKKHDKYCFCSSTNDIGIDDDIIDRFRDGEEHLEERLVEESKLLLLL
jgi:hypothetical protein